MPNDSAILLAPTPVSWAGMATKDALRQRVLRLVNQGVTQKSIALRMGMSETKLSRWLADDDSVQITVDALDGFNAFVKDLASALDLETAQAETAVAGGGFPDGRPTDKPNAGKPQHRKTGT